MWFPSFEIASGAAEPPLPPGPWELREPADEAMPPRLCGWRDQALWHFHFFGFARYTFDPAAGLCRAQAFAGAPDGQLVDTYQRAVLPFILQSRGTEVLHASAIDTAQGVVAFAAHSGTGKSTLAAAFQELGFSVWADDAVPWWMEDGRATTLPLPFRLRVGAAAGGYVPLARRVPEGRRPVAAIVVLSRQPEGAARLDPAPSSSRALAAVLPHAFCFSTRHLPANRQIMANHLGLVARVPVHLLRFTPALAQVSANADLVRRGLRLDPAPLPHSAPHVA